ncbi:hypothetical protein ACSQ67_014744 [Phaseolus vulgaris]
MLVFGYGKCSYAISNVSTLLILDCRLHAETFLMRDIFVLHYHSLPPLTRSTVGSATVMYVIPQHHV